MQGNIISSYYNYKKARANPLLIKKRLNAFGLISEEYSENGISRGKNSAQVHRRPQFPSFDIKI